MKTPLRSVPTQGPPWGYFKVIFYQVCQLVTKNRNRMAPRTGKRLQHRGRDTPTKGLMWTPITVQLERLIQPP